MLWAALALAALAGCGEIKSVQADASPADAAPRVDAPRPVDAAPDAAPCNAGNTVNMVDPASGHCYMLFEAEVSWDVARERCAELPGATHLVTLTSQEESDFVRSFLGTLDVWIGMREVAGTGNYMWITDEPLEYTNWEPGQPDTAAELCVRADGEDGGRWHDDSCGDLWNYMCEHP